MSLVSLICLVSKIKWVSKGNKLNQLPSGVGNKCIAWSAIHAFLT